MEEQAIGSSNDNEQLIVPVPAIIKIKTPRVRAYSSLQIINKKRIIYPFDGKYLESFGQPERHAKWFVKGKSGHGKSSFVFDFCNYMTQYGAIDYNSHEEGDSVTTMQKIMRHGLHDKTNFRILDKVPTEQWKLRLMKRKSAAVGVMDSLQHGKMNLAQYIDFTKSLCNTKKGKMLLFISHWVNNDYVTFVKHDCDIKIEVIGFLAKPDISRYGGGKIFIIWEEGAKAYWKKHYKDAVAGKYWPGQKI